MASTKKVKKGSFLRVIGSAVHNQYILNLHAETLVVFLKRGTLATYPRPYPNLPCPPPTTGKKQKSLMIPRELLFLPFFLYLPRRKGYHVIIPRSLKAKRKKTSETISREPTSPHPPLPYYCQSHRQTCRKEKALGESSSAIGLVY